MQASHPSQTPLQAHPPQPAGPSHEAASWLASSWPYSAQEPPGLPTPWNPPPWFALTFQHVLKFPSLFFCLRYDCETCPLPWERLTRALGTWRPEGTVLGSPRWGWVGFGHAGPWTWVSCPRAAGPSPTLCDCWPGRPLHPEGPGAWPWALAPSGTLLPDLPPPVDVELHRLKATWILWVRSTTLESVLRGFSSSAARAVENQLPLTWWGGRAGAGEGALPPCPQPPPPLLMPAAGYQALGEVGVLGAPEQGEHESRLQGVCGDG